MRKAKPKHELERIPGIGKRMAQDLIDLGYQTIDSLKDQDPQKMYEQLCAIWGRPIDRCVLYVFRCAVYYASTEVLDQEKLKWWNWKD